MAMAKDKPITEAGLKSVLRDVIAQEANEGGSIFKAVEDGVTSVGVVTEKTIEGFRKEVNQRFDKQGADLQIIKDDVRDLKADTIAQKDFEKLREKVEHHHPTN